MDTEKANASTAIRGIVKYALKKGLLSEEDEIWAFNNILSTVGLEQPVNPEAATPDMPLEELLKIILDDAVERGIISDSQTERDLLDTKIMGCVTPAPSAVIKKFWNLYNAGGPEAATNWFYRFAVLSDYIRQYRISRDVKWTVPSVYGEIEITINLSKPEKDPRAIAMAGASKSAAYPACQLCAENEGYAGRIDHPARQNLRIIPIDILGEKWGFQYSPYVYYNEHCIVLNAVHKPMTIDGTCFRKLFSFIEKFPHYFVGSNADLPIVGGSILSHEHFQGGRHVFPMENAKVIMTFAFPGFDDIEVGILHWPLSVLRLRADDSKRLCVLANKILASWKKYSDSSAQIFPETDGIPHNTITPIARMRGGRYELDLVLRNNRTSAEYPLGIFHPHPEHHHIKKENIGLIEAMGLAVLPSRLRHELSLVAEALTGRRDINDPLIASHSEWAKEIRNRHIITADNVDAVLKREVGGVFIRCLEDAGVFKQDDRGIEAFIRFVRSVQP